MPENLARFERDFVPLWLDLHALCFEPGDYHVATRAIGGESRIFIFRQLFISVLCDEPTPSGVWTFWHTGIINYPRCCSGPCAAKSDCSQRRAVTEWVAKEQPLVFGTSKPLDGSTR